MIHGPCLPIYLGLTTEYIATKAFLDKDCKSLEYRSTNNKNIYTLGQMGKYMIISQLPKRE